ncbi:MAG: hypothetical protein ABIL40_05780 [candidate division WOR-3 bacterium]
MKKISLILAFFFTLTWAIQPVPRGDKTHPEATMKMKSAGEEPQGSTIQKIEKQNKELDTAHDDHFIDTDSNNVNDQREEDLLKIKQLKNKFKDLFKKGKEVKPPRKSGHPTN